MRGLLLFLLALACACDPVSDPVDATIDGATDASMDTSNGDGGRDDTGPLSMDSGFDAGIGDSGWGLCSVGGARGTCLDVSDCVGTSTPGFCPGPANIQCCTSSMSDGGSMCDPAVMPTPNDGFGEAPGAGGCPAGMTAIDSFCIDRYEAFLVLVDDTGPIGSWSPFHSPAGQRVAARSAAGAIPQGYISGREAADACSEAGKRLCTDAEWLRACRGIEDRIYPYGETRVDGLCNDARAVHPAIERFGTSADWIWSRLGDACINQLPASLATAGANPGCVTPEDVYDLMGNLHEWTSDPAGTFRGGFYADTRVNGEGCLYRTTAHSMGHWDYSTGFRCCAD